MLFLQVPNLSYFLLTIFITFLTSMNMSPNPSLNNGNTPVQLAGSIIFNARDAGNRNIYAINLADLEISAVARTTTDIDSILTLSPDAEMLAFSEIDKNGWNIYSINIDGTNQHVLTDTDGAYPSWSPDGEKIAFVSWRSGRPKLYVMN
jgi:Tol biopolymer transport system component